MGIALLYFLIFYPKNLLFVCFYFRNKHSEKIKIKHPEKLNKKKKQKCKEKQKIPINEHFSQVNSHRVDKIYMQ